MHEHVDEPLEYVPAAPATAHGDRHRADWEPPSPASSRRSRLPRKLYMFRGSRVDELKSCRGAWGQVC